MSDAMMNDQISGTQENQEPERWPMAARVLMILALGACCFNLVWGPIAEKRLYGEFHVSTVYWLWHIFYLAPYVAGVVLFEMCKFRNREKMVLIPLALLTLTMVTEILTGFSWYFNFFNTNSIIIIFEIVFIAFQVIIVLNKLNVKMLKNLTIIILTLTSLFNIFMLVLFFYGFWDRFNRLALALFCDTYVVIDIILLQAVTVKKKKEIPQIVVDGVMGSMVQTYRLFCPSCGARFVEGKKFCDQCGNALSELAQPEAASMAVNPAVNPAADVPTTGIKVLSFFIPLAGFIMWASWINVTPNKAKAAGKFTLIGVIFYVGLVILTYAIYFWWLTSLF